MKRTPIPGLLRRVLAIGTSVCALLAVGSIALADDGALAGSLDALRKSVVASRDGVPITLAQWRNWPP